MGIADRGEFDDEEEKGRAGRSETKLRTGKYKVIVKEENSRVRGKVA